MDLQKEIRRLRNLIYLQCGLFFLILIGTSILFTLFLEHVYTRLDARMDAIEKKLEKTHDVFEDQLNSTMQEFNFTVVKVQEEVDQQVKGVNDNVSSQNSLMAYQFAATFAILGSLISIWHISSHLRNLNQPIVQRKIIAIMWMIPIYSISSWLGLVLVEAQGYLMLLKDVYEAYVIYNFLALLIAILGQGDRNVVIDRLSKHVEHLKPPLRLPCTPQLSFDNPRHKAESVLDQCQFFCMQFVLLRPITSLVILLSDLAYENRWDPTMPQLYMTLITNVSIFFAFAGLMKFYHAMKDELIWCNPFSKFLCIKGVVFMTFWQGVAISYMAHAIYEDNGDLHTDEKAREWSKRAQSFLVCLEMFVFAIAHGFVFPIEEWEPGYKEREEKRVKATFSDSLALKDFVKDVKTVMKSKKANKHYNMLSNSDENVGEDDSELRIMGSSLDIEDASNDKVNENGGESSESSSQTDEYINIAERDYTGEQISNLLNYKQKI